MNSHHLNELSKILRVEVTKAWETILVWGAGKGLFLSRHNIMIAEKFTYPTYICLNYLLPAIVFRPPMKTSLDSRQSQPSYEATFLADKCCNRENINLFGW